MSGVCAGSLLGTSSEILLAPPLPPANVAVTRSVQVSATFPEIQCGGPFLWPVVCFLGFLCCCIVWDAGKTSDTTTWGWAIRHRLRAQDSLTSDTSWKFGTPQTTLTFFQLSANLAVPNIPSGSIFIKTTHRTQGSAILTITVLLWQKDTNEPAKGRDA